MEVNFIPRDGGRGCALNFTDFLPVAILKRKRFFIRSASIILQLVVDVLWVMPDDDDDVVVMMR